MTRTRMTNPPRNVGTAHVLALVFLVLLSVLTVALASGAMLNLLAGDNHRRAMEAQLAAESGLAFILDQIGYIRLDPETTQETMAQNLAEALGERLNGTDNLDGQQVTASDTQVTVPPIQLPPGSFQCTLRPIADDRCTLIVQGSADGVVRTVAIDLRLVPRLSAVFDYGVASFGPIAISGSAKIIGVNDASEADVLAAAAGEATALTLSGNAVVDGDAALVGDGSIAVSGTPSLGGTPDPQEMAGHIRLLGSAPQEPLIDTATLAALATNVVDCSTDTSSSGLTFNNIRIAADTNPTFSSDVVINGIVYVESPNVVTFSGQTTLNGMVVTEDGGGSLEENKLIFSGKVEAYGVENLPDSPEFAAVKQQTGTFVLAPGFAVIFSGQFSAINGTIAADQLTFTGQAEGIVKGAVIGLGDAPTSLSGKVEIRVDRLKAYPDPAGFVKTLALEADAASYVELVGG